MPNHRPLGLCLAGIPVFGVSVLTRHGERHYWGPASTMPPLIPRLYMYFRYYVHTCTSDACRHLSAVQCTSATRGGHSAPHMSCTHVMYVLQLSSCTLRVWRCMYFMHLCMHFPAVLQVLQPPRGQRGLCVGLLGCYHVSASEVPTHAQWSACVTLHTHGL